LLLFSVFLTCAFDCYFDRKFWAQPDHCCQSGGSDCDARLCPGKAE
jgi:hypothetical protein